MAERFRYTEEQWAKIKCELPTGADANRARRSLERWVDGWCPAYNPSVDRKKTIQKLRVIAAAARQLSAAVDEFKRRLEDDADLFPEFPVFNFDNGPWCRAENWIEGLKQMAANADAGRAAIARRGRAMIAYRNQLIVDMMVVWFDAGGELRASGGDGRAKSGGPLVRFLLAASKPANVVPALTVDSARGIVRKYRCQILDPRWGRFTSRPRSSAEGRAAPDDMPGFFSLADSPQDSSGGSSASGDGS